MQLLVDAVQFGEQIEIGPLTLGRHARGRRQVEYGSAVRPQRRALIVSREEAVGPVRGAALREHCLGKYEVAGQILVLAAQSISDPRPHRRVAAEAVAGVQMIEGSRMVD